jgi:hypothetical protein
VDLVVVVIVLALVVRLFRLGRAWISHGATSSMPASRSCARLASIGALASDHALRKGRAGFPRGDIRSQA